MDNEVIMQKIVGTDRYRKLINDMDMSKELGRILDENSKFQDIEFENEENARYERTISDYIKCKKGINDGVKNDAGCRLLRLHCH